MKIRDLLSSASIVLNGQPASKAEALEVLFDAIGQIWQHRRYGCLQNSCT